MNGLATVLALAAACLAALVGFELLSPSATPPGPAVSLGQLPPSTPPGPQQTPGMSPASLAETVLARPLFSQTRRPPDAASPATEPASAVTPLPRMTGILVDGPRRSAIFASRDGKPTVVAEGGRIGPFTVQSIEPEQVIVVGPEGRRTVRTSFDPTLQPPPMPPPNGLGAPQFPGIAIPPTAPGAGYGLPQSAGAAR